MNRASAVCIVLVVAAAATVGPVVGATEATAGADEPGLTVALQENGSAAVTLSLTYDLDSDDEREAFESLRDDPNASERVGERFADRMARIAAAAENETGREMDVSGTTVAFRTVEASNTGVVYLTVEWEGLAAVEGNRLVVTEPFASGFAPDRTFTLVAPEGYRLSETTPEPDAGDDRRAVWNAGSDLSGFRAVAAPPTPTTDADRTTTAPATTTATDATTDDGGGEGKDETTEGGGGGDGGGQPGFGIVAALAALATLVATRRQKDG